MGTLRRGLPAGLAAVAALTLAPAVATAGSGGTTPPATTTGNGGGTPYEPGVTPVPPPTATSGPRDQTPSRHGARPRLTSFSAPRRFFDLGSPARVRFRIDAGAATVHVRLEVRHAGRRVELIDLGERTTGSAQAYRLTGREGGALPEGALQLKLLARDASGRGLSPASRASDTGSIG
ncbi:MAG: hypothetical protein QOJ07_1603, partial [Thermoleophilaceae bacterium]|nr:hypothetical protein [Thermoleophilaceae bacterium]